MKKLMTKFFKSSLVSSCILILLGLLLIFQSEATIVSLSYIIGAVILVLGVAAILKYIKDYNTERKNELDMIYGIICIILGIIVIMHPHAIASVIPLIVGVLIILNSAAKFQYSLELKKDNNDLWKSTMALAIITTICGIILIFNPFQGAVLVTRAVGILILIYAILDLISTLSIRNSVNQIQNALEESVTDAEIVEEKEVRKKSKKKEKKTKKK